MASRIGVLLLALAIVGITPRVSYARGYTEPELRSVEKPEEAQVRRLREEEENQLRIALGRRSRAHRRADLFLRLAEIYLEAYHSEFLLEGRVHDKRLEEGRKDAYIDRTHSRVYLSEGIKACKSILSDGIRYGKMDEVYYFLAFNYGELGDQRQSLRYFRKLVEDYPDSPMVSEGYVELGDAAYGNRDFREAQRYYGLAARKAPSDTKPLVLHKLAWSFYRTRDFNQAVDEMKQAIALASQNNEKFLGLREEALRDMAVFMTEGGRVDEAIGYFKKVAGDKTFYPKLLEKLGEEYEHNVQGAKAVAVYHALLKTSPDDATRFRVLEKLVELDLSSAHFAQVQGRGSQATHFYQDALSLIRRIFDSGGIPGGSDAKTQLAAQNLRALVRATATENHKQYRKDQDRVALQTAASFYEVYLERFLKDSDPRNETPEIRMYLAEVDRDLGNSKAASDLYREVVDSGDSRYAKQAGALWTASLSEAIHKEAASGKARANAGEPSALEKQYIDAADRLQNALGNTTEGREAALKAAQVEAGYTSTQSDAIDRARKLIKMAPKSPQALTAARLWIQIESDQMARNPAKAESIAGELKDAIAELQGNADLMSADRTIGKGKLNAMLADQQTHLRVSAIARSEKEQNYSGAAKGYESFAHDAQSRALAEKAYASAVMNYVKASDADSVNRVAVEWLRRYPASPRAMDALRGAATQLLIAGDFAAAAAQFAQVGQSGDDSASLETAALIDDGVGNATSAQGSWRSYLARYSRGPARGRVILALAKSFEAQRDDSNAAKYYKLCMGIAGLKAECGARLGDLFEKGEDFGSAAAAYRAVAGISPRHGHGSGASPYVGYARFKLAQAMERRAHFDPLALPASQLKKSLGERTSFLRPLSKAYMNAVEAGGPWAVAALDGLAQWATRFADEIDAIAPPDGSKADQVSAFKAKLRNLSDPLRKKAIATWSQAYRKAAAAESFSPVLPAIADHLADAGAGSPMRAQGYRGKFRLAGLASDGGKDGKDAALAKVKNRLTRNARDASAWIDYGNLLWGSGRPLLAKIMYEYALTLSPGNAAALNNSGVLAATENEEDWAQASEAAQDFREALERDSFFLPAKVNLAALMNYYRLFSKARKYWEQVRTRVQNNPDVEDGYAIALQGSGDPDSARSEFAKATRLGADSERFAAVFHEAARQSFDRAHLRLAGEKCLGKLEGIHEDALAGFEKSASESLKKACTQWAK